MKKHIPQQIIVPVYYYIEDTGEVHFDIEQMNEYFQGELQKTVFGNYTKEYIFKLVNR